MKTKIYSGYFLLLVFLFQLLFLQSNAQGWSTVGNGILGPISNPPTRIRALCVYNGELYVGGVFDASFGNPSSGVARWNGTSWLAAGSDPVGAAIECLSVYNGELFAGGTISAMDGNPMQNITKWNGSIWQDAFIPHVDIPTVVNELSVYNGDLYLGLGATIGNPPSALGKWDGTSFTTNDAFSSSIKCLGEFNGDLIVGGNFVIADNIVVNDIARRIGSQWDSLGSGTNISNSEVVALAVYNGELYAAGHFSTMGGDSANHIARWNGTSWSDVGGSVTQFPIGSSRIFALAVYEGELYAAGIFSEIGGIPANNIAKWNGTSWAPLCSGVNNGIWALEVYNGELYAGGIFTTAGDIPANRIARWSLPKANVTPAGPISICNNTSVTLTANSGNYVYQWYNNNVLMTGETNQQLTVNTPGIYSVVTSVIDQACAGIASSVPVQVTEGFGPVDLTITTSPTEGCLSNTIYTGYGVQTITLTANATGAISYLWSTGQTTQSIAVSIASTYSVTAYDANGCASAQTPQTEITINVLDARCGNDKKKIMLCHYPDGNSSNPQSLCISSSAATAHLALHSGDCIGNCSSAAREIIAEEDKNEIVIYPNPVTDNLTIKITTPLSDKKYLSIYNLLGEKILEQKIISEKTEIDLSNIPLEVYFVAVTDDNGNKITRKFIKM